MKINILIFAFVASLILMAEAVDLLHQFYPAKQNESFITSKNPESSISQMTPIRQNSIWKPASCAISGYSFEKRKLVSTTPWAYVYLMEATQDTIR